MVLKMDVGGIVCVVSADVRICLVAISGIADVVLSLLGVYIVYKMETRRGYWFGALFCAALGIL